MNAVKSRFLPRLYLTLRQGEQAGLSISRTLALCEEIDRSVARPAARVGAAVKRGTGLAEAGFNFGLWSGVDYHCLKAAQLSGTLEQMFGRLAQHHSGRQQSLKLLRSDLIPVLMLFLVMLAVMPLPQLVSGAWSLVDYGYFLISRIAGLLIIIVGLSKLPALLRRFTPTTAAIDRLLLLLPVVGGLYLRRQLRDFFYALALLLEAGIDAQQAVTASNLSVNSQVRQRVQSMLSALEGGVSFTEALAEIDGVNSMALAMASSGEAAGRLDELLMHYCQLETEITQQQNRQWFTWLPRVIYLGLAGYIGWQLIAGSV